MNIKFYVEQRFVIPFIFSLLLFSCGKKDTKIQPESENTANQQVPGDTAGRISTEIPIQQYRGSNTYNWQDRHQQLLSLNKKDPPKNVFLGNSIIHYWGGQPVTPKQMEYRGADSWDRYFRPKKVRNMAFSYDRIENVLWRVYHGELDGFKADNVLLLIGTNNLSVTKDSDSAIVAGLRFLLNAVKRHQPDAHIILMGLLPRKNYEQRIAILNSSIEQMTGNLEVQYINVNSVLLQSNGKIDESLFVDGLHPNVYGYRLLAPVMSDVLK